MITINVEDLLLHLPLYFGLNCVINPCIKRVLASKTSALIQNDCFFPFRMFGLNVSRCVRDAAALPLSVPFVSLVCIPMSCSDSVIGWSLSGSWITVVTLYL